MSVRLARAAYPARSVLSCNGVWGSIPAVACRPIAMRRPRPVSSSQPRSSVSTSFGSGRPKRFATGAKISGTSTICESVEISSGLGIWSPFIWNGPRSLRRQAFELQNSNGKE